MSQWLGIVLASSVVGSVVAGAWQFVLNERQAARTEQKERAGRKELPFRSYLHLIANIPHRLQDLDTKGDWSLLHEMGKERTRLRVERLFCLPSEEVERAMAKTEAKLDPFIERIKALFDENANRPRDERLGTDFLTQQAFDEVMWPAIEELAGYMVEDLGWI